LKRPTEKAKWLFVIVKGAITHERETIEAGQMLLANRRSNCCIEAARKGTQVLLFWRANPLEKTEPLLL